MAKSAFIDPSTGVLKAFGYIGANAPGDTKLTVADSFALTPGAWRWTGATWVAVARPDWLAFEQALGGIFTSGFVPLLQKYPAMLFGLRDGQAGRAGAATLVYISIVSAQGASDINGAHYAAVKSAASAAHIPVALP